MQTERLEFALLQAGDLPVLEQLLGDPDIMYAWEHGFSAAEAQAWLNENLRRYADDGYSYGSVRLRSTGVLIGVMGLLQEVAAGQEHTGIGYILHKNYWQQGYAAEGAAALLRAAFVDLDLAEVTAQVRINNFASQRVAARLGMTVQQEFSKIYRGQQMPHYLYSLTRTDWQKHTGF